MRSLGPFTLTLALLAGACSNGVGTSSGGPGGSTDGTSPGAGSPDGGDGTSTRATGSCQVAKKGTAGVLLQGRVLAPSGAIDGEVLVGADGKIACADTSCAKAAGYETATVIACPDSVIAPGLVNGHDHTEYDTRGPLTHGTERWQHRNGWRTGAGGETALPKVPSTTDTKTIAAAELRFVLGGATSVVGSGGVAGLLRNLANYKDKAQLEGLTGAGVYFDTFPLGDSSGKEIASGCAYPSVRTASSAFAGGAAYAPHISEGINAAAENEFTCLEASLVTSKTAIIHAVGLTAKDADVIAKNGAKVIWSARTNIDLYGNTAPVTLLKNMGVTIGLGTDWLASGSMNMLRELACVDSLNVKYFDKAFDDRALVEMATKGNATALGVEAQIGELSPGHLADIAIFHGPKKDYRAVLEAGVEDVELVLRGGKPLYGEAAIVEALQPTCADLAVCGTQKKVCLDTPGVTLADVQAVAKSSYPLFFCKTETPKDEPSCVPYRDTYPNGSSATDRDGDGIPDAKDDCPSIFNPARPMDGTSQSDSDGDGVGDACDAKPLDPSAH